MDTLLIDDDSIGVFLTERLLKREGFDGNITSFSSAQDALEHLQAAEPNSLPQLIFLDLNMPVMDGWEFLDALKPQETQLLGRCHVYILTSSLAHSDACRIREFPLVAGLIHKPLDAAQIHAVRAQVEAAASLR
ncbi:response regulator [Hymenobacter arizonensis]|uniref:Response regulator receiver domain-containing protein n=1 Tax=Hymenobacter arizonensis TaxID=1227077 RepID=A0A1I6B7C2_HYMAR|nr:response regulator [Hymenobacter arizonensis]SFQ76823.1 Response regulator receiver domain-containing protein [Hymenobacter arizonensis]